MNIRPSSYIGPPNMYDYMGAMQFCNLFMLGLRHNNTLLDFGCGSLRLGRFAIQYLNKGNYFGIEPKAELVEEGIKLNYLTELIEGKQPCIRISDDCDMTFFKKKFDYIIAQSVFTHMPPSQVDLSLQAAFKVMADSSLFIANYKNGSRDYEGETWTQKNIAYTFNTINTLIRKNGLKATPLHLIHTTFQTWLLIRK